MQRIFLAWAALSFGFVASPLSAQTTPDEPSPPAQQSTPPAEPVPPPFPPMPSSRPTHRWVDVGGHHARRTEHRTTSARHHTATTRHHATPTDHRRGHKHERHEAEHKPAAHLSRRTIRQCHDMSYKQMMRHDSCRSLMRQELDAAEGAHHRATHRHKTTAHEKKARRDHHRTGRHKS